MLRTYSSHLPAHLRSLTGTRKVKCEDFVGQITETALEACAVSPGYCGSSTVVMRDMWVCACSHNLSIMGCNYVCVAFLQRGAPVPIRSLNLQLNECTHKNRLLKIGEGWATTNWHPILPFIKGMRGPVIEHELINYLTCGNYVVDILTLLKILPSQMVFALPSLGSIWWKIPKGLLLGSEKHWEAFKNLSPFHIVLCRISFNLISYLDSWVVLAYSFAHFRLISRLSQIIILFWNNFNLTEKLEEYEKLLYTFHLKTSVKFCQLWIVPFLYSKGPSSEAHIAFCCDVSFISFSLEHSFNLFLTFMMLKLLKIKV